MSINIKAHQHTLRRSVTCQGIGLHTGRQVKMTIKPAGENQGICFYRSDLTNKPAIPARMEQIVDTTLATTISNGLEKISTTEHLMAALHGAGIDNATIDIDSHEVPIMDGSAGPFIHLLKKGGLKKQRALRKVLRITKPISLTDGDKSIRIEPYKGFKISGTIKFGDNDLLSEQSYSAELTPERFINEIAEARTFGFVEQVEELWRNGLALGGTLQNVIAIHWDRKSVLNEDGLRFEDEFIRHKMLDLVGDLALLGSPVLGHVIANRSGHGLHHLLMQTIIDNPDCWEYVKFHKRGSVLQPVVQGNKVPKGNKKPSYIPGILLPPLPQQVCMA
ncbi:MAG: UDP-3-O-acyl-N-acetylglucosamine deacetylase [Candidatus Electrothrix aestuarii]|uniref:UDP-3-O-acyl-N-acetylglucosamine deacetylase n=1 Tax=Candidatus Electrothrix aestuarii TaxID=3062594 RepID=A0AAU8LV22_9BACT|nr:UDP-3-O-acyl-N-acetylglucosamine deacetylase [Candidatus Electrothrix aestuarii]